MRTLLTALVISLPPAAGAETPMTADAFETYVTGKTLTYSQYGQVFGTEEYLANRKVRWSVSENLCQYGSWYADADKICFVYEYDPDAHCWTFWQDATGLRALSVNDAPGSELSEVEHTDIPLQCPGPDVGT